MQVTENGNLQDCEAAQEVRFRLPVCKLENSVKFPLTFCQFNVK
jgi:hypothetical protein